MFVLKCFWKTQTVSRSNVVKQIAQCRLLSNETNQPIVIENRGNVRLIGINRPHKRNAVDSATAKLLYKAFDDFDKDSDSSVAVLHGLGGTFCAGYDLSELGAQDSNLSPDLLVRGPLVKEFLNFLFKCLAMKISF